LLANETDSSLNMNARIDEHAEHWSIRQAGVFERLDNAAPALTAPVTSLIEREHVGEPDAAMPAAGEPFRGYVACVEQACNEETGEPRVSATAA
jgi:hypothetical protein